MFVVPRLKTQRLALIGVFLLFFISTLTIAEKKQDDTRPVLVAETVVDVARLSQSKVATSTPENNPIIEEASTTKKLVGDETEVPITETKDVPDTKDETTEIKPPKTETVPRTTPTVNQSSNMASLFLDEHNKTRQALGLSSLVWSDNLAKEAQAWSAVLKAEGCKMRHDLKSPYGENIYWQQQSGGDVSALISSPLDAVFYWVDEERFYNYNKNTCRNGEQCGHYTQVVWADTTSIGCGVSSCQNSNTRTDVWVCRYNPAGNVIGEKPY